MHAYAQRHLYGDELASLGGFQLALDGELSALLAACGVSDTSD